MVHRCFLAPGPCLYCCGVRFCLRQIKSAWASEHALEIERMALKIQQQQLEYQQNIEEMRMAYERAQAEAEQQHLREKNAEIQEIRQRYQQDRQQLYNVLNAERAQEMEEMTTNFRWEKQQLHDELETWKQVAPAVSLSLYCGMCGVPWLVLEHPDSVPPNIEFCGPALSGPLSRAVARPKKLTFQTFEPLFSTVRTDRTPPPPLRKHGLVSARQPCVGVVLGTVILVVQELTSQKC